jgi:hypothetical protein
MNIIDKAVKAVVNPDLDPNSREFMLEAFKETPPPEDLDPWKTTEDIINDELMKYSSTYNEILEKLMKEYTDGNVNN